MWPLHNSFLFLAMNGLGYRPPQEQQNAAFDESAADGDAIDGAIGHDRQRAGERQKQFAASGP